ncbi:hypothetical protein NUSPORA_00885 [Nucleospora cyclopteri]
MNKIKLISCLLQYLCNVWVFYHEYKYNMFINCLEGLLEQKKEAEFCSLHGKIRKDALFMVEKGCCHGIFDKELGNRNKGVFYVNRNGRLALKNDLKFETGKICFVLSLNWKLDADYEAVRHDLRPIDFINSKIYKIYFDIYEMMKKTEFKEFYYKEVEYKKEEYNNLTIYKFKMKDLFSYIEPIYDTTNAIAVVLKGMLRNMAYKEENKFDFSEKAVETLLKFLEGRRVLKKNVNLEMYPDLIPLITPFDFTRSGGKHWKFKDLVSFGFDLRNVEKSDLKDLFNMEEVNKLIKEGGIYISNILVTHSKY